MTAHYLEPATVWSERLTSSHIDQLVDAVRRQLDDEVAGPMIEAREERTVDTETRKSHHCRLLGSGTE